MPTCAQVGVGGTKPVKVPKQYLQSSPVQVWHVPFEQFLIIVNFSWLFFQLSVET